MPLAIELFEAIFDHNPPVNDRSEVISAKIAAIRESKAQPKLYTDSFVWRYNHERINDYKHPAALVYQKLRADKKFHNMTCLQLAVYKGQHSTVEALLKAIAENPNEQKQFDFDLERRKALELAIDKNDLHMLSLFKPFDQAELNELLKYSVDRDRIVDEYFRLLGAVPNQRVVIPSAGVAAAAAAATPPAIKIIPLEELISHFGSVQTAAIQFAKNQDHEALEQLFLTRSEKISHADRLLIFREVIQNAIENTRDRDRSHRTIGVMLKNGITMAEALQYLSELSLNDESSRAFLYYSFLTHYKEHPEFPRVSQQILIDTLRTVLSPGGKNAKPLPDVASTLLSMIYNLDHVKKILSCDAHTLITAEYERRREVIKNKRDQVRNDFRREKEEIRRSGKMRYAEKKAEQKYHLDVLLVQRSSAKEIVDEILSLDSNVTKVSSDTLQHAFLRVMELEARTRSSGIDEANLKESAPQFLRLYNFLIRDQHAYHLLLKPNKHNVTPLRHVNSWLVRFAPAERIKVMREKLFEIAVFSQLNFEIINYPIQFIDYYCYFVTSGPNPILSSARVRENNEDRMARTKCAFRDISRHLSQAHLTESNILDLFLTLGVHAEQAQGLGSHITGKNLSHQILLGLGAPVLTRNGGFNPDVIDYTQHAARLHREFQDTLAYLQRWAPDKLESFREDFLSPTQPRTVGSAAAAAAASDSYSDHAVRRGPVEFRRGFGLGAVSGPGPGPGPGPGHAAGDGRSLEERRAFERPSSLRL